MHMHNSHHCASSLRACLADAPHANEALRLCAIGYASPKCGRVVCAACIYQYHYYYYIYVYIVYMYIKLEMWPMTESKSVYFFKSGHPNTKDNILYATIIVTVCIKQPTSHHVDSVLSFRDMWYHHSEDKLVF